MTFRLAAISVALLLSLASGCGKVNERIVEVNSEIYVYPGTKYRYELEIQYLHEVQGGNAHMPLDVATHRKVQSVWLYTDAVEGLVLGSQIHMGSWRGDVERPSKTITGQMNFFGKGVMINLAVGEKNLPFQFNGYYRVVHAANQPLHPDASR